MIKNLIVHKPRSNIIKKTIALALSITCATPTLPTTAYASEAFFNGGAAGSGVVNGKGTWNDSQSGYRISIVDKTGII